MTENNFNLFITVDRNLPYQQNLQRLTLTIVVLRARDNTRTILRFHIPKIFRRFAEGDLQSIIEIG